MVLCTIPRLISCKNTRLYVYKQTFKFRPRTASLNTFGWSIVEKALEKVLDAVPGVKQGGASVTVKVAGAATGLVVGAVGTPMLLRMAGPAVVVWTPEANLILGMVAASRSDEFVKFAGVGMIIGGVAGVVSKYLKMDVPIFGMAAKQ